MFRLGMDVPCWIKRLKRLPLRLRQNLTLPLDAAFEYEIEKELMVETHKEVEEKLNAMSDEEFLDLLRRIERRKRRIQRFVQEERREQVQYIR